MNEIRKQEHDLQLLAALIYRKTQGMPIDAQIRQEALGEVLELANQEPFLFNSKANQALIQRALEVDAFGLGEARA